MDKNINSALSNGQQLEILAWETFIYWSALFIIFSLNMGHTVFSHGLAHIHIQRNSERNKCWIQVKELVLSNVFGPVKFQKGWYEYYVISSAAV